MKSTTKTSDCPYCRSPMEPVAMRCGSCGVEIRGRFAQTQFGSLPGEDLRFLEKYLLAEFSIKALAEKSGMGYTAIRSRLDRIIATYRSHWNREEEKLAILERVEKGEITAGEAAEAIGNLK
jgi:hypothetical protein